VAAEFGPRLEARILSALNSRVGDIVKAAKARAEEPAAPVPAPESARDRQMREAGIDPDLYKAKGGDRPIGVLGQEKKME